MVSCPTPVGGSGHAAENSFHAQQPPRSKILERRAAEARLRRYRGRDIGGLEPYFSFGADVSAKGSRYLPRLHNVVFWTTSPSPAPKSEGLDGFVGAISAFPAAWSQAQQAPFESAIRRSPSP